MHINIQKMLWKKQWQNGDFWDDGRLVVKGNFDL